MAVFVLSKEVFSLGPAQIAFMALIIILYAFQNFFCKRFSLGYPGKDSTAVLTIIGGIIVVVVTFLFSGCTFSAQALTVILGIVNAVALYFYNDFLLKASVSGPYSVLIVFAVFGGISLPALTKWIGFNDKMTGPAMCFLAIILVAVYLMSVKPSDENTSVTNKITLKFLLYSVGLFICNGSYASILALQQELTGEAEKEELIMVTFAAAALFSFVSLIVKKSNLKSVFTMSKSAIVNLLVYALSAGFAINSLVIILLLEVNTGVLLAVQNAGVMLVSVIFSLVFFKEKLTKMNIVGCFFMTVGLVGITVFEKISFSQLSEMISGLIK